MYKFKLALLFGFTTLALASAGCNSKTFFESMPVPDTKALSGATAPTQAPVNPGDPTPTPPVTVCDPFGGGQTGEADNGLVAQLKVLPLAAQRGQTTAYQPYFPYYDSHGIALPAQLFFRQVNVPTRQFTRGFEAIDGSLLKAPDGTDLVEWFSVFFQSELQLASGDANGMYQLAVLSDDGSNVFINDGSGMRSLISNDGETSTRLGCTSEGIALTAGMRVPIQLQYHQGPRTEIAIMLLWRPWPHDTVNQPIMDPLCAHAGSSFYFDPATSAPAQGWNELVSRGWQVIPPQNFHLPSGSNPCPSL